MKKLGLLNAHVSRIVASMGHTDLLVVTDAGFPCPLSVERIDLAVTSNVPTLLEVLDAILGELCIEKVYIARETAEVSPGRYAELESTFGSMQTELVSHAELKKIAVGARAVIRTGDFTPYANVILQSGVPYG